MTLAVIGSLLVLLLVAFPSVALPAANWQSCSAIPVRILGADADDAPSICEGARDAFSFFERRGFHTRPVVIEVHAHLPPEASETAAGAFWEPTRRVLMCPYSAFLRNETWFNVSIDRGLYRSMAAHEVAHALAARNFAVPNPTIQAKEYVAYVTMFATMNPILRTRILNANSASGFESTDRITEILYSFDPMRFAVESYRHYVRPENGPTFLEAVLRGEVLTD